MRQKITCPKCGCKRWRNVGEIAAVDISEDGKIQRDVVMKIVECMKCDHDWVINSEPTENTE